MKIMRAGVDLLLLKFGPKATNHHMQRNLVLMTVGTHARANLLGLLELTLDARDLTSTFTVFLCP